MARSWHLVSRPAGLPEARDFALADLPEIALREGEVRVRNLWLSVDPYMRGRMNDAKSYIPAFALNAPMEGGAIGEVIESRAPGLAAGDRVIHMLGWREEAVGPAATFRRLPPLPVPEQRFLGDLGLTGMTAWFGLLDVAKAQPGETLFVSGAAGAVGSAVVQIAVARGLRVIGSAGGAEKAAHVLGLGAAAAIDYKAESLLSALGDAAPAGIDIYFDNVGGSHLDAALAHARDGARFAMCGMVETYNGAGPVPLANLMRIVSACITVRGFIVSQYMDRSAEFYDGMGALIAEGKLRSAETVREGIEAMPGAFLDLFSGGNVGKMLVRL